MNIDKWYFEMLDNAIKQRLLIDLKLKLPKERDINKNTELLYGKGSVLTPGKKVGYMLVIFIDFIYESLYFYFYPFAALVVATTHFS